jgi:hypothetical protein
MKLKMDNNIIFEESQYLGQNKSSLLRRTIFAVFCFMAYYYSENTTSKESENLFFFLGVSIVVVSTLLVFVLHFKTKVENGSIVLDGLWTSRKVKIDLSSIQKATKVEYSRLFFNKSVYNLHNKGLIYFYTRGKYCVELTDKDGLIYLVGSQRTDELTKVLNELITKN